MCEGRHAVADCKKDLPSAIRNLSLTPAVSAIRRPTVGCILPRATPFFGPAVAPAAGLKPRLVQHAFMFFIGQAS
jgi:hypothetical protein